MKNAAGRTASAQAADAAAEKLALAALKRVLWALWQGKKSLRLMPQNV